MRKQVLSFIFCSIVFSGLAQNRVGIGSKTPTSTLTVEGSIAGGYREITTFSTPVILEETDHYVTFNANGDGQIILPVVEMENSSLKGRMYKIKNISKYTVTITPALGEKFRNFGNDMKHIELKSGQYVEVVCNGQHLGSSTWDISSINLGIPEESSVAPGGKSTWQFDSFYDYIATSPQEVRSSGIDLNGFSKTIVIPPNKEAKIVLTYSIPVGSESIYGYYGITLKKDNQEVQAGSRKVTIGPHNARAPYSLTTISATVSDTIAASSSEKKVTYSLQTFAQDHDKSIVYLMLFGGGVDDYNYNWGKGYWSITVYFK
ncbi:hypothetical protein M2306_000757 [Myroides gitamensis]|uniref:hypothetical protein n=1 Tax=Myroides odoratus TaxID=256 RepID=UPI002166D4A5|nr:hypothetical protein [Myroides odoratus]MCS4237989.1 hypothetical protein [Myroides odoratus]MDH6600063.1 hypothetical protein [Myroides gitamensis]